MGNFSLYTIKSFKHNGHIHRIWVENWAVPKQMLHPDHVSECMHVLINDQTRIQESDGREWVSRIPAVSFFIPRQWFNIVALIEEQGIRYYCNIASPPYVWGDTLTYIDYDLDVVLMPDGEVQVVDEEEYARHKLSYHYSQEVEDKVKLGLESLLQRIHDGRPPFQDKVVQQYYELWKNGEER